jgi:hypothetical protein
MKNLLLGTLLLATLSVLPLPAQAEISINIGIPAPPQIRVNIPLPPRIRFAAPPRLVVVPETYVYVAPDVDEDIFFVDGWWWRPWEGRWYRSRNHDSGWHRYKTTPSFYRQIPHNWRNDYRERHWRGQQWDVEPLPHRQVQKNWKNWKTSRHWEKERSWGVRDLRRDKDGRHPPSRGQRGDGREHGRDDDQRRGK